MMKKFLSLLSVNATLLSFIPFTVACKQDKDIKVGLKLEKIFNSEPKTIDIGISKSILSITNTNDDQWFEMFKGHDDYFKNLQFIALNVLNKLESTCFLDTSFIDVTLYRNNNISEQIKNNDDLKKDDLDVGKSIYIGFSTIVQSGKSENNYKIKILQIK